ncbi:MAG: hypothetical protein ABL929_02965 [Ferruginibacter sp.]|nr:hypothetical protein [Ferruginibacter sp.]
MKNKLFDDFVKGEFGNYKPEVPLHIWENIAKQKENKKPLGIWFNLHSKKIAVFAIATIILSSTYYAYVQKNKYDTNKNTKITAFQKLQKLNKIHLETENEISNNTIYNELDSAKNLAINIQKNNKSTNNNTLHTTENNLDQTIPNFKKQKIKSKTNITIKEGYLDLETTKQVTDKESLTSTSILANSIIGAIIYTSPQKFVPKLAKNNLPNTTTIPCPEAEKNTAGNKRYVEMYGGPDYILRSFEDTSNSNYLKQRKASTGIHYAYSAGVRYTKVFGNGVSFKTGINYSQINENFIAKDGYLVERVYVISNIGDTIGSYINTIAKNKTNTNIYRNVDVPILLGYELGNKKLHTNISAGVLVNILSKKKGNVIDEKGNIVDISSDKKANIYQYKTNVGISFMASVGFYYKLNKNMHFLAEPYFRYSLSSITKPEISLKQKYHTAGVRLGLRLDF